MTLVVQSLRLESARQATLVLVRERRQTAEVDAISLQEAPVLLVTLAFTLASKEVVVREAILRLLAGRIRVAVFIGAA